MLKHSHQRHLIGLILFLLFGYKVAAQTYQLSGNYFVRSSTDFLSFSNQLGVLYEGSTFRVVNRIPKSNGAEALEIEITAMSRNSHVEPSPTGKIYIYKPGKKSGFINRATGEIEAGPGACETCDNKSQNPATIVLTRISDSVIEMANTAPKAMGPNLSDRDPEPKRFEGPVQKGSLDDKIKHYSESTEVSRMIDWAMQNKKTVSKGKCYRKVKEAMATQCGPARNGYSCRNPFAPEGGKKGLGNNLTASVSTDIADSYALSAKTRLKKEGFLNLMEIEPYKTQMRSPSDAPKGAVLVYSSGIPCEITLGKTVPDCGHTEIKVGNPGQDGYVSDYYSKDAINETPRAKKYGSNYKLVGIMIKPKDTL